MNNQYFGNPNGFYGGYQQQAPMNSYANTGRPKFGSTLTEEEIKHLTNSSSVIDMRVTKDDMLRARCCHRYTDGSDAIIRDELNPNHCKCNICGADFNMFNGKKSDVENIVNELNDVIQTTKMIYLGMPDAIANEFTQFFPLIKLIPEVFNRASASFNRVENYTMNPTNTMNPGFGQNGFAVLGSILSNPYGYNQQMQQPPMYGYQQQMQQPPMYGYQQPPMTQQAPQYMDQNSNPMAYGAPQQMPQQQAPGVGQIPQAPNPTGEPFAQQNVSAPNPEIAQASTFGV